MRFQVKIGRLLKEGIERRRPQKAVQLEVANTVLARRNLVRGGDDVQAALIKDDGIGFDLSLLGVFAWRLVFSDDDAALEDGPVDGAQDAVLPLVAFGGHAADEENLAIRFIVLP